MTFKHSPATPLPWTLLKAREDMSASIAELDGAYTNEPMHVRDAAYIAHAANAYPVLVEALHRIAGTYSPKPLSAHEAGTILRELGEI